MSRRSVVVVGSLATVAILIAGLAVGTRTPPPPSPAPPPPEDSVGPSAELPPWRWSREQSGWEYSAKRYLADTEMRRAKTLILNPEVSELYTAVFTRQANTLYVARFCRIATGCNVEAIDFPSGRQLWAVALEGIGPTHHSKYRNGVNIEADRGRVIVFGNEAHGRYVEVLDARTGKQLGNQKLEADFSTWGD